MAALRIKAFCGLLVLGCLSLAPVPLAATEFCDIRKTKDGFAALRAAPNPKARLIARMHVGDEVLGDGGVNLQKGWMYVTWWKGGRFKGRPQPGYDKPDGKGWVHTSLIADECG